MKTISTSSCCTSLALIILALSLAVPAFGQQGRRLDPRLNEADPDTNFVEVAAGPPALWCAVSDAAALLVIGHQPGAGRHLSLVPLDADGKVVTSAPPFTVVLPKPASLAPGLTNIVSTGLVHPTLPVLYVWQDIVGSPMPGLGEVTNNPVYRDLDRLLVYALETNTARLVTAVRGDWFRYGGVAYGSYYYSTQFGIDPENRRLFLPALRTAGSVEAGDSQIGYIDLDENGMPVAKDGKVAPRQVLPVALTGPQAGFGWAVLSSNTVVTGAHGALVIWDLQSRRERCQLFAAEAAHAYMTAGHPNRRFVYYMYAYQVLAAVEFVDNQPTLQPRFLPLGGPSPLFVAASRQRLVFAAGPRVYLVRITKDGELTGDYTGVNVPGFGGLALTYSPRFSRVYVAVDQTP
ncbi:hypothetical protein HQ590_14980 [bacterium]|nr:hypothetical protein [bacterium]